MPDDPNSHIEEQLKAWAQKRRGEAGAPFELHPATRKLLQDEVARTYPKPAAAPLAAQVAWWRLAWPRLAVAGSICGLFVAMLGLILPGLSKAKAKSQLITASNYLKQIGIAAQTYAADHGGRLPGNFEQMRDELGPGASKVVNDPETGKEFVYLGAGKVGSDHDRVLAYSPVARGRRPVLLGDGRVEAMGEMQFQEALQRTLNDQGTTALAAARDPRALAESKPAEREFLAQTESKDARLKAAEQPASREARKVDEAIRGVELASSDKSQQAPIPPAASASRNLNAGNERDQTELRQRYGLVPGQAGGVTARTDASNSKNMAPSAPQVSAPAGPRLALDGAKLEPGAVGGKFAGGRASTGTAGANVVLNNLQNGSPTDNFRLGLMQPGRAAAGESVVTLDEQGPIDRLGTGNTYAYKAGLPVTQAALSYSQARRYRVNFNSPPMPNVLRSFEVAQNGQQIRVVDADGSVYDGAIEQTPFAEIGKELLANRSTATDLKKSLEPQARLPGTPATTTTGQLAPQNSFFRVAGTNRTLNQWVVFEGNFLVNTNPTSQIVVGAKLAADQAVVVPQQNLPRSSQQLGNDLIQGQATIGNSNRIQINAVPTGP